VKGKREDNRGTVSDESEIVWCVEKQGLLIFNDIYLNVQ
jgi:hypothetical protein